MTKAIFLAVGLLCALPTMKASADTYIYTTSWFWGIDQAGVIDDNNPDSAIICGGGVCFPIPNCSACHSQPVDNRSYTRESDARHRAVHFPASALRLGEGQQIKLESLLVTRAKGLLVVQESKGGRRFQLPPDAYVVKGKDGKALFMTYKGGKAPQLLR